MRSRILCSAQHAEHGPASLIADRDQTDQLAGAMSAPTFIDSQLLKPSMSEANKVQVAGNHYKGKTIQPWDYIAANELGYFEGNIVKYVSRWRDKGGIDDLRKARHYLDKLIELELDGHKK